MTPEREKEIRARRLEELFAEIDQLREKLAVTVGALTKVSKVWHEDCGCVVECKIACEAISKIREEK